MNVNDTEIERKWILPGLPKSQTLSVQKHHFVKQAYFAVTPDIECRLTSRITADSFYSLLPNVLTRKMTIKVGSGLIRPEYELNLTEEQFLKAQHWVQHPAIDKEVWCFNQPYKYDALDHIVVCHVDPGKPTGFWYCEVEFSSEAESKQYELPPIFEGREVTGDPKYSMKNYWLETRCN